MPIQCPKCHTLDIPDFCIGKKVKCLECGTPFIVNNQLEAENIPHIYKTISDIPENKTANIFYYLGVIIIILGSICLFVGLLGVLNENENTHYWGWGSIFSGIGTIISSIWFFGVYAIICAVSRNTLEIHLFRKQQNKNDVEKQQERKI